MPTHRLEAFSESVLAIIIITIMVLELNVPHGASLAAVLPPGACPALADRSANPSVPPIFPPTLGP